MKYKFRCRNGDELRRALHVGWASRDFCGTAENSAFFQQPVPLPLPPPSSGGVPLIGGASNGWGALARPRPPERRQQNILLYLLLDNISPERRKNGGRSARELAEPVVRGQHHFPAIDDLDHHRVRVASRLPEKLLQAVLHGEGELHAPGPAAHDDHLGGGCCDPDDAASHPHHHHHHTPRRRKEDAKKKGQSKQPKLEGCLWCVGFFIDGRRQNMAKTSG